MSVTRVPAKSSSERALEAYVQQAIRRGLSALGEKRTSAEDFHGTLSEMSFASARREWIH
jgi:hypothetical protein